VSSTRVLQHFPTFFVDLRLLLHNTLSQSIGLVLVRWILDEEEQVKSNRDRESQNCHILETLLVASREKRVKGVSDEGRGQVKESGSTSWSHNVQICPVIYYTLCGNSDVSPDANTCTCISLPPINSTVGHLISQGCQKRNVITVEDQDISQVAVGDRGKRRKWKQHCRDIHSIFSFFESLFLTRSVCNDFDKFDKVITLKKK
jgi:hypothetical protein